MSLADVPVVGLFGEPPRRLVGSPDADWAAARQFSPLVPQAGILEAQPPGSLAGMAMLAPPGTLERRFNLAGMLRALASDAKFIVLAPKDMGGARLARELAALGCNVEENAKAHHRICRGRRPQRLDEAALDGAHAEGAPRRVGALDLWSQPGIFSWDRIDPGTALLAAALPRLSGRGADLGCGIGVLAHAVLGSPTVTGLELIDIDRRAVEVARLNVNDPRAAFRWADVRAGTGLEKLDFVVTNPPFHEGGAEDKSLGQTFIRQAAASLRSGGQLWLVANRHLPYEAALDGLFRRVTPHGDAQGFKIVSALK